MSDSPAATERTARILPWLCLGLLVLPFHPLWIDFEQVRRGLLLILTGATLTLWRRLPNVRGERYALLFLGALLLSAVVQAAAQAAFHDEAAQWSFQPWEAAYRIAHWLALLVIVRLGASQHPGFLALPASTLLAVTSLFGILQRLGLAEIAGYGVEREPVSTLGNLNVASEWTAVAAVAVGVLRTEMQRLKWLPIAALLLAGCYLVVNHSRSGLVAAPTALLLLFVMRRSQRGLVPLLLLLGGAALGLLIDAAASRPQPTEAAMQQELERSTVTLGVRFEIARSASKLFAESPVFGKGPGQFAVEYPRHRTQAEIEASSFGRQFATEVRTVHDDWLELLVDGGLLALAAFATMLFTLQRGMRDKERLLPLFALLLLMLVRAPIGNAPAAALAFWMVGSSAPSPSGARRRWLSLAIAIPAGLAMVVLGMLPVGGNTAFAPYVRAVRNQEPPPTDAAADANWWMPFEPRWLEIMVDDAFAAGDLPKAAHHAARALQLRPFAPPLHARLARVMSQGGRYGEALKVAEFGLDFDPANPELHALRSAVYAELGDVDRAIEEVVANPHPRLREQLEHHFADLALRADKRGEPKHARRYLIEFNFVGLIARLGQATVEEKRQRAVMYDKLDTLIRESGRQSEDIRAEVAAALMSLELGKPEHASRFAKIVALGKARLTPWQASLLGPHLDRLRALPAWAPLLPPER